jgi:hypothetical protein
MKQFLKAALLATTLVSVSAFAGDVGVAVSVGQPGFYGRIELGDFPQPALIYNRPVVVDRVVSDRQPVYLRVPFQHRKHWNRYCHRYNACGDRVLFVQDNWYNKEYVPRYQQQHRDHREMRGDERRDMRGDERRDMRGDERRDMRGDERRDMRGDERREMRGDERREMRGDERRDMRGDERRDDQRGDRGH